MTTILYVGNIAGKAMPLGKCSVSRSPEEAARDPEWPGPPIKKLTQARLVRVPLYTSTSEQRKQTNAPVLKTPVSPSSRIPYVVKDVNESKIP